MHDSTDRPRSDSTPRPHHHPLVPPGLREPPRNLVELLQARAEEKPGHELYRFLRGGEREEGPWTRAEIRIVPSEGVQEPHRAFWLVTQAMLTGLASPPRYRLDRSAARSSSFSSLGRRRLSPAASLRTMVSTHVRSSSAENRAGMSTIVRPPSR